MRELNVVSRDRFFPWNRIPGMEVLVALVLLAAASACGSEKAAGPGGSGGSAASGGTGGEGGSGGFGGEGGSGGVGGEGGIGGVGGEGGIGGAGGEGGIGGAGGVGGEGGTGGVGGEDGTGGVGGEDGTGGVGGEDGTGGVGGEDGTGGVGGDGGSADEPVAVRVGIAPDPLTLVELDVVTLTATAFDGDDRPIASVSITWTSSDPAIVSVNDFGLTVAHRAGTATITANVDGIEGGVAATVTAGAVEAVAVVGMPSRLSLGETASLTAIALDTMERPLPGRMATWTSSEPTVATVDATGLLTALAVGTTTITAEIDGVLGEATVDVEADTRVGFAMGDEHTCYLDPSGTAWCWGRNNYGQLGDGTSINRDQPAVAAPGLSFRSLAAGGQHSCGVTTEHAIYCWGRDVAHSIGGGGNSTTPVLLAPGPYDFLGAMLNGYCAMDLQGQPYCWGDNSSHRELGHPSTSESGTPLQVSPPAGEGPLELVEIGHGEYHSCGLTSASRLFCWGHNVYGQLGDGSTDKTAFPIEVFPGQTVEAFGLGARFTCATADGVSYCWGFASDGRLGIGNTSRWEVETPMPVLSGGVAFTAFAGGTAHMCALDADGQAWCWGSNIRGQLGILGPDKDVPTQMPGNIVFTSLAAKRSQTCGTSDTGAMYCWGDNSFGQLGNGSSSVTIDTPTEVQW